MNHNNEGIKDLDDSSFEKFIKDNRLVLVDFWAPWCMPCQLQGRLLRSNRKEFPAPVKVTKVNVDNNPSIARKYRIKGIPQMYLFVDGKPAKGWTGVTPVNSLVKDIKKHLR